MTIFIDITMILLLIGVIVRTIDLNNRLNGFKKLDGEITPLLRNLSTTLNSSSIQIEAMKKASKDISDMLNQGIERGNELKSDIDFMINHGEKMADKLESLLSEARLLHAQLSTLKTDQKPVLPTPKIAISEKTETHTPIHIEEIKTELSKGVTKDSIRSLLQEKFQEGLRRNA
jgi:hypothetical protein